jgi:F0F1-type ATP synthase assembly protein I
MPSDRPNPESEPPKKTSGGLTAYVEAEKLMQIAFVLPASVFLCWGAGWGLDRWLHQRWMAIAGLIFGCIAGMYQVIQIAMATEKKTQSETELQNGSEKESSDRKQ